MIPIPEKVKTAKNLTIAMCCVCAFLLMILHNPTSQDITRTIVGIIVILFICFHFYRGKNWARIWYAIGTILGSLIVFLIDVDLMSKSIQLTGLGVSYYLLLNVAQCLQIYALVLLYSSESSNWYKEIKYFKAQQSYDNSQQFAYQSHDNYRENNFSNANYSQGNTNQQAYSIIINCPRCSQKLRVPGDRVVITKCSRCGLEFKSNS